MYGRQLCDTPGKQAHQGICPARSTVHREGLVGDVEGGRCLGKSDHKMVEFSILGEVRMEASKTATLDF